MSAPQQPFYNHAGIPQRLQAHGGLVASNRDLKLILDPWIERAEAQARKLGHVNRNGSTHVLEDISLESSALMGLSDDAGRRRLYGIRNLETETSNDAWTDAFLDTIGSNVWLAPMPMFPATKNAAREMVAAYSDCDLNEPMTLPEQRQLARMLHGFARGYCYAERAFEALEAEREEEAVA